MRKITVIIALFLAAIQIVSAQKVGLVLSGGGAKGAAHIGVIKALEENNIPIDYITGTSIGAIIGSLYAMGYSPEEMLELMLSKEFSYWQTGTVEEQYTYYFKEPYPTPEFAHFSIDMSDSLQIKASFLPQSLINPIQMNQAFMALFSQATAKAGWNFDNRQQKPAGISTISLSHSVAWPRIYILKSRSSLRMGIWETPYVPP